MTTTLPAHLLPVLRHAVEWVEDGGTHRAAFQFKSDAKELLRELKERGVEARRLQV